MTGTSGDYQPPTFDWQEPDEGVLAHLTRIGTMGADRHVIDAAMRGVTGAEQTRIAVQESLRVLLANGLIVAARAGEDFFVTLDRPDHFGSSAGVDQ